MHIVNGLNWHLVVERVECGRRGPTCPDVAGYVADDAVSAHGGHGCAQRLGHNRDQIADVGTGHIGEVGVEDGLVRVLGEARCGVRVSHQ